MRLKTAYDNSDRADLTAIMIECDTVLERIEELEAERLTFNGGNGGSIGMGFTYSTVTTASRI